MDAFEDLFAECRGAFSQDRVYRTARDLAISSLLALGTHTITGLLTASGREHMDWTSAYRLFERERIDKDALFAPAIKSTEDCLSPDAPLVIAIDDTLIRKRGRKVCGASWRRDPLGPAFHTNFVWGQRFFQASAALPEAGKDGRACMVPIDFTHAPSAKKPRKTAGEDEWSNYRHAQKEMGLCNVAKNRIKSITERVSAGRSIVITADGGYTNATLFRNLPEATSAIGRIRKDARIYEVPGGTGTAKGRKRYYGKPLPTPEQIRQDDSIPWQQAEAFAAGKVHTFDIKIVNKARWRGTGDKDVSIVIIRPLAYRLTKNSKLLYRNPSYLLCTDTDMPIEQIFQYYLWRWEIEVNFRDEKTVLGVGQAQVRTQAAVENAPALGVAAYAYLLLAAAETNCNSLKLPRPKWQPNKPNERCSTQQILSVFRAQLWGIAISGNKIHFANTATANQNPLFCKDSLAGTVYFMRK